MSELTALRGDDPSILTRAVEMLTAYCELVKATGKYAEMHYIPEIEFVIEELRAALSSAPMATEPPAPTERMVQVTREDANNYCRVLTALGMEEEGDPVAEIERLIARAALAAVPVPEPVADGGKR